MTKHRELIARLEALTGPDREVDADIWLARDSYACMSISPSYTGSLNAAVALCDRVLPGYLWSLSIHETGTALAHVDTDWEGGSFPRGHKIPVIALLIATLKALDAKETEE